MLHTNHQAAIDHKTHEPKTHINHNTALWSSKTALLQTEQSSKDNWPGFGWISPESKKYFKKWIIPLKNHQCSSETQVVYIQRLKQNTQRVHISKRQTILIKIDQIHYLNDERPQWQKGA